MNTPCDRRRFLQQAAAALAAASPILEAAATDRQPALAREPKGAAAMLPILDTHQHLWDLDKFRLPWIKKDSPLARSYLMSDYLKATEGLNVVKSVYMEVDVEPAQQTAEAEYVIDICTRGKTPMVAAVISGRPASDGFKKYITPLAASKYIKGVRQVLHNPDNPAGFCLGKQFIKSIRLLGDLNLSFDLCLRPGELLDGAKLIDACPDTRFILDHCGNANVQAQDLRQWQRDIEAVAKRKKVVCKVSGIVASAKPGHWSADDLAPIVNHTLDVFGPDRVMFGGDWPVCTLAATYKQWVEALKAIVHERKEEEQRKLFHENALRVYGLK
jgi:predicted TIM-barrel fold metal-dependent hydrolase